MVPLRRRRSARRRRHRWQPPRLAAGEGTARRTRDLAALREALEEAARRRLDVVVCRADLTVGLDGRGPLVYVRLPEPIGGSPTLTARFTAWALGQLARMLEIPEGYAARMLCLAPDLWEASVRRWLRFRRETALLLRLRLPEGPEGEPELRAVLSDRYRPLDNLEVLEALEEALGKAIAGLELLDAELDGEAMWIRLVSRELVGKAQVGDALRAGVVVHNSEVGDGALVVEPFLLRLVCSNGMVLPHALPGLRRVHVGPRHPRGCLGPEHYPLGGRGSDGRLAEAIRRAMGHPLIEAFLDEAAAARGLPVQHPAPALARLVKRRLVTSQEREAILRRLLERQHPSVWDLANAITATARHEPSARRYALERLGGELLVAGELQELVRDA